MFSGRQIEKTLSTSFAWHIHLNRELWPKITSRPDQKWVQGYSPAGDAVAGVSISLDVTFQSDHSL